MKRNICKILDYMDRWQVNHFLGLLQFHWKECDMVIQLAARTNHNRERSCLGIIKALHLFTCVSVSMSVSVTVCACVCLPVCSIYIYICLCVYMCLGVCLCRCVCLCLCGIDRSVCLSFTTTLIYSKNKTKNTGKPH